MLPAGFCGSACQQLLDLAVLLLTISGGAGWIMLTRHLYRSGKELKQMMQAIGELSEQSDDLKDNSTNEIVQTFYKMADDRPHTELRGAQK